MASDSDNSLIIPGAIRSERPVVALRSAGRPHNGLASRGKTRNSAAAIGRPCAIIVAVRAQAARHAGATPDELSLHASDSSAAPVASTAGNAAAAASIDWP